MTFKQIKEKVISDLTYAESALGDAIASQKEILDYIEDNEREIQDYKNFLKWANLECEFDVWSNISNKDCKNHPIEKILANRVLKYMFLNANISEALYYALLDRMKVK